MPRRSSATDVTVGYRPWRWVLLLLVSVAQISATPSSAHQSFEADELLWFLVISDTHVGAQLIYGDKDTERFDWATSDLVDTVRPSFLVNAGDLTDATAGLLIPTGQKDGEWESYHSIWSGNGMTSDFYFDLPGNHDHYGEWPLDHYFTWSLQGHEDHLVNHYWVRTDGKGNKLLFIGLATCASNGAIAPLDDAGLDTVDMAFLNQVLEQESDADAIVIFGHHPVGNFNDGQDDFRWILENAGVTSYVYGHTHSYDMFWENGALQVNLDSLTKGDEHNVGLFALDGLGLSAKVFTQGEWPQVLVTSPLDATLAENHLYDYMVSNAWEQVPVRALALDPDGVENVFATIDNSLVVTMEVVEENVWQGTFDPKLLSVDEAHTVEVVALSQGKTASDSAVFYVFDDPDPVEENPEVVEEPWVAEEIEAVEVIEAVERVESSYEVEAMDLVETGDFEIIEETFAPDEIDWTSADLPGETTTGNDSNPSDGEVAQVSTDSQLQETSGDETVTGIDPSDRETRSSGCTTNPSDNGTSTPTLLVALLLTFLGLVRIRGRFIA